MVEQVLGRFTDDIDLILGSYIMTPVCQEFVLRKCDEGYSAIISVKDLGTSSLSIANGVLDLTGIGEINEAKTCVKFSLSEHVVQKGIKSGQFQKRLS